MTIAQKILTLITIAIFILVATGVTLYSTKTPASSLKPTVVATFYPLSYFAQQIAGDNATVTMLIPDNVEPHTWEPTITDIITVSNARLFVYNGAGFEPWVTDLLSAVQNTPLIVVDTSATMNLTSTQGTMDPHFWLDPVLAQTQVTNIMNGLIQADPSHAASYTKNADLLTARLETLHQEYLTGLRNRTKNDIITTHEGFDYLARRYGFVDHAAIGISADAQPSAQDMARLVQLVKNLGLHYVFVEPIFSDVYMDTIAQETSAKVLVLDGIHGRTGVHAHMDYFQIMEENLRNLRIGLEVH